MAAETLICPVCFSANTTLQSKGFDSAKGVVGAIAVGPVGALAGLHKSGTSIGHCLKCGHQWDTAQHAKQQTRRSAESFTASKKRFYVAYEKGEFNNAAYYTPEPMRYTLEKQGIEAVYKQLKATDRFMMWGQVGLLILMLIAIYLIFG